jgi:hypothetical protein
MDSHVQQETPPARGGKTFRQRTIEYWERWADQQDEDHGVRALDPDIQAHAFEPLAGGSFSVIRTKSGRYYALVRVDTVLGHLCLAFHLERHALTRLAHQARAAGDYTTAGFFDDIGSFVSHAASDIGHAVSHVASDIGHGVSHVASDLGHGIASATQSIGTFVSHAASDVAKTTVHIGAGIVHAAQGAINAAAHAIDQAAKTAFQTFKSAIPAAAKLLARAHLGDIGAADILRGIGNAAKQGIAWAGKAMNTVAEGAKFLAKVVDIPKLVADVIPIPAVKSLIGSLDPLQKFSDAIDALQHGDFNRLKKIATDALSAAQSVISLVPGIGTGISAAIGAAEAVLEGGSALDIALRTAYGAIPIPPGLRGVTDTVLDAVLALVDGKNITDAALTVARDRIPAGVPRDVFDTLASIVVKHHPITKVIEDVADHYVSQYTKGLGSTLEQGLAKTVGPIVSHTLSALPDPKTVFAGFPKELKEGGAESLVTHAGHDLGQTATAASASILHSLTSAMVARPQAAARFARPALRPLPATRPPRLVLPIHLAPGRT